MTDIVLSEEINSLPNKIDSSPGDLLDIINLYSFRLFLLSGLFLFGSGISLFIISYYNNQLLDKESIFWANQGFKYLLILGIQYVVALLVKYKEVKVNYTRKMVHISYFIWPQILDKLILGYHKNIYTEAWNIWIILLLLFIISEPFRKKIKILETMYLAVDRPEDRPYTLIWFSSQIIFTLLILIPYIIYFKFKNKQDLIFIPILINGLGDGLAEPVGIYFGKHKYKTKAFLSSREYTRSYEGSMCVYLVSLVTCLSYYDYLKKYQYIFGCFVIPILATISEAYAPHTWDSPFIYFIVLSILVITINLP